MKVMIMTDLEGITGVDSIDMMDTEGEGYKKACLYLADDINAAVKGCFEGGADTVYVVDGHGGGKNLDHSLVDPRAHVCVGKEWTDLIESGKVDVYMEVGCHAMPGTINGFLDHTQNSKMIFTYAYNGVPRGEIFQGAAYVGVYGIPFVMVSGDLAACSEGRALLGDIEIAPVKYGIGRNTARSVSFDEAHTMIQNAAKNGCLRHKSITPYKVTLPMEIRVTFYRSDFCEIRGVGRGRERLDARTSRRIVNEIHTYADMML